MKSGQQKSKDILGYRQQHPCCYNCDFNKEIKNGSSGRKLCTKATSVDFGLDESNRALHMSISLTDCKDFVPHPESSCPYFEWKKI